MFVPGLRRRAPLPSSQKGAVEGDQADAVGFGFVLDLAGGLASGEIGRRGVPGNQEVVWA